MGGPLTTVMIFYPGRSPDRKIPMVGPGKKKVRYARRSNGMDVKKKVRLIAWQQWETVQVTRNLGSPDIFRHFSKMVTFFSIELFF